MLVLCALTALGMGMAARFSFQSGFLEYLAEIEQDRVSALAEELEDEYTLLRSWDAFRDPRNWRKLINRFTRQQQDDAKGESKKDRRKKRPGKDNGKRNAPPPPPEPSSMNESIEARVRRNWESAHLRSSLGLLDADRSTLIAGNAPGGAAVWTPIVVGDAVVGWLTREPMSDITSNIDLRFQEKQRTGILVIGFFGFCLAALLSMLLARTLIAPLRRFAGAVKSLSEGDFSARVSPAPPLTAVGGKASADELQILAAQLNHLAHVLETNEQSRRTFMAEIAHDLRTPLSVLRGEIEALEDGVRPVTSLTLASLRAEVELLGRLVDDVQTLSLADLGMLTFAREALNVADCLLSALSGTGERIQARNIRLDVQLPDAPVPVMADSARLTQVFRNVLENALRYTDGEGVIQARCHTENGTAVVDVLDSPPAVPEEYLPFLFDRFYTGDAARSRHRSGSGLGLAICRSLLEAQEGDIRAMPSPLGGLWIRMRLPLAAPE